MTVFTAALQRLDAWINELTGLGLPSYDKSQSLRFSAPGDIDDRQLSDLYHYDPFVFRVCNSFPATALKDGFTFSSVKDPSTAKRLTGLCQKPRVMGPLRLALDLARAQGGSLLYPTVDEMFEVIEKTDIGTVMFDSLGRPSEYWISPSGMSPIRVSSGDVIRFDGAPTSPRKRRERMGWDLSEVQRAFETIKQTGAGWQSVFGMLHDASQGVFKMNGLTKGLANPAFREVIQGRLRLLDLQRGNTRGIAIDADDDFLQVTRTFTGVPDTLDRIMMLLSMATKIPVTILMGRSPAGENATGESDFRAYYDEVGAYRLERVGPGLLRIAYRMAVWNGLQFPADLEVTFPSLITPSANELATEAGTWASALSAAVTGGIADPHAAAAKFEQVADLPEAPTESLLPDAPSTELVPDDGETPADDRREETPVGQDEPPASAS